MTLESQRQRDQVPEELPELREQLVTMTREHQHQHQTTLATVREITEELRKEVADSLLVSPKIRSVWPSMLKECRPAMPSSG